MIAIFRRISRHEDEISQRQCRGPHKIGLHGDAVAVACRDLHDGLDAAIQQQMPHRLGLDRKSRAR
jgi:hypothetical protein